jgi:predicted short-subunit dehydrogenase-like oxidoreductase (DUF2520 family)
VAIPTLTLIGGGHVGRVLGRLFAAAGGFRVQDVLTRSLPSARAAVAFVGAGHPVERYQQLRPADLYMLAVGDDQIGPCCAELALGGHLAGAIVFHCSGALSSADLAAAAQAGAAVASVHPIRSFADPVAVARDFAGTFCGIEGDARALDVLQAALCAIGARPIPIEASAKTLYHAASVFACNFLVTVLDVALRAYQAAGIPEDLARQLAQPLVAETVANVFRLGPAQALSGPIARGDVATVAKQQGALDQWDQPAGQLYDALAGATFALAARKRKLA